MSKLLERKLISFLAEQIAVNPKYGVRKVKGISNDIAARLHDSLDILGDEVAIKDAKIGYLYTDAGDRGGIDEWMGALRESAPYYFDENDTGPAIRSRTDLRTAKEKAAFIGQHGADVYMALPE